MKVFLSGQSFCRALALAGTMWFVAAIYAHAQTNVSTTQASEERLPAPRRPSIILIVADDLGYGDLGCYGNTKIKTPHLDKLAAEGARFTSFYGGASLGVQSRASLLTGRNAAHLGSDAAPLPPDAATLSQFLKDAGYRTGFIGQWGLNGLPDNRGFDQVAAGLSEENEFNHYPLSLWRFDNVMHFAGTNMPFFGNENGRKALYFPDLFTEAGANFIANNRPQAFNKYRSFFLCLSYNVPHAKLDLSDTGAYAGEKWPEANRAKAAMISRLDLDVGQLLQRLQRTGQTNNVMIIFTSGNGPDTNAVDPKILNSAGGLRGAKGELYEGGIRVPMIVWLPSQIKPAVVNTPLANWDILPTLADVAWRKAPKDIDGISFWPTLTGNTQTNVHEFLYWENSVTGARAVRMGDWKAVRPEAGAMLELYDLKDDSHEKENVAGKNPAIVSKVEGYLKEVRAAP